MAITLVLFQDGIASRCLISGTGTIFTATLSEWVKSLPFMLIRAKSEYYSKINAMSFEDKQSLIGKTAPTNTQTLHPGWTMNTDGEFITYTVRNGDTIWDIVKMYDDVTTSQVLSFE